MTPRDKPQFDAYRRQLLICVGPYCTEDGMTRQALRHLAEQLDAAGLLYGGEARVKPTRVHCLGACSGGPIMCVQPDGVWYCEMTPQHVEQVIAEHLVGGRIVDELVFHRGPTGAA